MSDRIDEARARAHAYVLAHGDPLAQLRARALAGLASAPRVTEALLATGALRAGEGRPPAALLPGLAALDDLDQLGAPALEPVVVALAAAVGEAGDLGDPAGPLEERIVETAMLGGFLTKTLRLRPRARAAIDGFLARTWSAERVRAGAWGPIAAYAHWYSLNDAELSDPVLQWCGRELERGFRTRAFDAVATARVFCLCRAFALPGSALGAEELRQALADEQTGEGGFALSARALAGEPVAAALDALAAFRLLAPPGSAP